MAYPDWPLFDLRLRTRALELRPIAEADLSTLADLLPADLEMDPAATTYPRLSADANRRVIVHQSYWQAYGTWAPTSWRLPFVVIVDGCDCRGPGARGPGLSHAADGRFLLLAGG
jgi:hypothetical protein